MAAKKKTKQAKSERRFVLLSDLHAHAWSAFAKGDGEKNSRLQRSLQVMKDSLDKARELDVPWVFGGDIVHTAGYTMNVVLFELIDALKQYDDVVKLAVWGNHDARGVGGRICLEQTVLATIQHAVRNFIVLDPSLGALLYEDPKTGLTFAGAGYQPRAELLRYAQNADIGIYHQTVRGTKTPAGVSLDEGIPAEELVERHKLSVVGHVHHWQHAAKGRVLIPGSPEHHNFGDVGDHGWWIIDVDAEDYTLIEGGSPKFLTVETPDDVKKDGNFYRVRHAPGGVSVPDGAIAIAPTPTAIESRDMLHNASGEEVLHAWMRENPHEHAPAEKVLELGKRLWSEEDSGALRPMRLAKLRLHNFCSYADQEIDINPGTRLVLGKGRDFPSNGAGKSTIFESIYWLLFGRTTKDQSGDEVIRWGAKNCEVTGEFVVGDGWLRVRRTRGKNAGLFIESSESEWEAASSNEMTDKLLRWCGLTPELYKSLAYFSQEKLLLFASATDGERKDMLADLIGLASYQTASALAQSKCSDLEDAEAKQQAFIEAAEERIQIETQRLHDAQQQRETWEQEHAGALVAVREKQDDFEKEVPSTRADMVQAATRSLGASNEGRRQQVLRTIDALQDRLNEPVKAITAKQVERAKQIATEAQETYQGAMVDLGRARSAVEAAKKGLSEKQSRLKKQEATLAAGFCPSCQQPISDEHRDTCLAPYSGDVAAAQQQLEELEALVPIALTSAADAKRTLETSQALVKVSEDRLRAMQAREQVTKEIEVARGELVHLNDARAAILEAAEQRADESIRSQRAALEKEYADLEARTNPFIAQEDAAQVRVQEAEAAIRQRGTERDRIRQEITIFDYWRRAFSKQGIQSLLIDQIATVFNENRGSIFPSLTQGIYDVQFSTLSQTKAGEWRERTEFQVYQRGELVPYAALSGGQRRRIDVGVMLTLVKAVSTWMQVPGALGILILDEVFGFLDGSGAEGLMEALREVQEQIPSIFVVSHEPELQALFPEVIRVEQDGEGTSRIMIG